MAQFTGTVVWFNNSKGFGFLRHEGGEVFVHYTSIASGGFKSLKEGEPVLFDIVQGKDGPQADNVVQLPHIGRM